jgi:hypothetical protein
LPSAWRRRGRSGAALARAGGSDKVPGTSRGGSL